MKLRSIFSIIIVMAMGLTVSAQEKTDTFKVYGNCGMCKSRIEKASKLDGVSAASWNKESKMFSVTYDPAKVSNESIQKSIAAVGHDTELFEAPDKVYKKLHACCLYERKRDVQKTQEH
ncbi:MAG: heavy-metal-associated domain-containing protein [Chitinophagaceae bacterium]|jgi:copper chaperone CopZ|nr:heavy-metal-associated domain-containing protein [Chitinophagaceae bacterium]MCU0403444.1 heavy-metal-associated domain-containing protein [Chitinophagaceae bacterium]